MGLSTRCRQLREIGTAAVAPCSSQRGGVIEGWHDFFVAQVGACAALTGLLFVALSINISPILATPSLPARAGQTLVVVLAAMFEASLALLPTSQHIIAIALTVVSIGTWFISLRLINAYFKSVMKVASTRLPRWIVYLTLSQVSTILPIVGGMLMLVGRDSGIYWIAASVLCSLAFGVYNSWVLLIEILR